MRIEEFRALLLGQLNALLGLAPGANLPGYLVRSENPLPLDERELRENARAFAEELILCLDDSAASRVLREDQERTRLLFVWTIGEWSEIDSKERLLEDSTLAANPLPFYAVSAWILDMVRRGWSPEKER